MRKFYTNYVLPAAVFAVSLLSYGCVDREYSLDNIDGGGSISVGDVITTPPVTAHLTFEGILGGMDEVERILEENGLSFEDIGFVEMYIGEELFLVNLPLDIPLIPEGMTDTFLPEGDDKVDLLLAVGQASRHLCEAAGAAGVEAVHFADKEALAEALLAAAKPGDAVLVKASHGMAFETILSDFYEKYKGQTSG